MLDIARDYNHLTFVDFDHPITELHAKRPIQHEEHLVSVTMSVPIEGA
jgi:hypothetical protein